MRVSCSLGLKFILVACAIGPLLLASSPPAGPNDHERDQITLRMVQLAEAGRVSEARDALRTYLREYPTDGTMLYNLACFDLLLKEKEQALTDLESALLNGYTNFRLIDHDRSLDPLREDPRFVNLVHDGELRFREEFHSHALALDEGYPQPPIPLRRNSPDTAGPQARVGLSFDRDALHVVVSVVDPHFDDHAPLWRGGSGVLINLVRPLSPDDYESRQFHSLGIGTVDGKLAGMLVARDGKVLLRPLPDLKPRLSRTQDEIRYEVDIDWRNFRPYGPPLDQEMGLNIFYIGAGLDAKRPVLSLMPEERLSFEAASWRRYVQVRFNTSDRSEPVLRGRLLDRLVEGETVEAQLAIWSRNAGPGVIHATLTRADGSPVADAKSYIEKGAWEDGLNFFNISVGVETLASGLYHLRLHCMGPDGISLDDIYEFSRFPADWLGSVNQRIHALQTPEKSILKYRIFVLTQEVNSRGTQDDTAHLHSAYRQLVGMVKTCEQKHSCLPDQGLFLGGFETGTMTERSCAMYLPAGYRELDNPQIIFVLPAAPGTESELAAELGAALDDHPGMIVLVPQSHGYSGLKKTVAAEHTRLAVAWALELFGAKTVTLVGLGWGADAALEFSLEAPDLCRRVLLDEDRLFAESTTFDAESLRSVFGNRRNTLSYTLVSRKLALERKELVHTVISELGFHCESIDVSSDEAAREQLVTWLEESAGAGE